MLRSESTSKTFLYFAYGSNMLTFRLNMNNITAEFISIARFDNYRLDFIRFSKFWGGPTATVVHTANAHVWGVVWRMQMNYMETLDEQEGVEKKIYYPKYVQVVTPYIGKLICRIYIKKIQPLPRGDKDNIPSDRWPSWTYKEIIILGAMEHELPEYYVQMLEKIKNNGEKGCFKMYSLLLQYAKSVPCPCKLPQKKKKPPQLDMNKLRKEKY